jgi:hypothetical protein
VLAAGWSLRLLHLLVDVAMHGLLALAIAMGAMILLVALAVVAPSPPPRGLSPPLGLRLTYAESP